MDKSVIIVMLCVALSAWIAWLIYNYAVFNKQVAIEAKVDYWKNRVSRVRDCLEDLVDAIHKQFPKSTIEYSHNDEIDEVSGEIKY
jgi:hypothetical protein